MTTHPALQRAMRRLFTDRRPAWPLALARIVIGVTVLLWSITMWFDVTALLGEDGLLPPELASNRFRWIDLDTGLELRIALAVLVVASLAIIVGWKPTIWLLVAFVLLVAVQRRNHLILNSGDVILRDLTLLLACTPTGAALSLDRYRRLGRDGLHSAGQVAPWGMRLVQLQVMVVYFFAFWSKGGDEWREGIAVSTALRLQDLQRIGELDFLVANIWVVAAMTWGTLLVELMLGTLLWYKPLRPLLIALGVLLHVSIDGLLLVGFFGLTMIGGLMTFLDGDSIQRSIAHRRARQDSADADDGVEPDGESCTDEEPAVAPETPAVPSGAG